MPKQAVSPNVHRAIAQMRRAATNLADEAANAAGGAEVARRARGVLSALASALEFGGGFKVTGRAEEFDYVNRPEAADNG